jgi:hypothetical protein
MDAEMKTDGAELSDAAEGAIAAMVEEGASVEGDTLSSVELAAVAALDLAAEELGEALGNARVVALRFEDDGSVRVSALTDEQATAAEAMLAAEGVASKTVAMADLKGAIEGASEDEGDEPAETAEAV